MKTTAFKFIQFKTEFKFKEIFILVTGSLYPNYYNVIKGKINDIIFLPICCIFTSIRKAKEIRLNKFNYKEIKSSFYNKEGVKTNFVDCIRAFEKYILFYEAKLKNIINKNTIGNYEGCLTFELIFSKK